MAYDYAEDAQFALEMIEEYGRPVVISKLSAEDADNTKPWRGAGAETPIASLSTTAAFIIPNTSIPTESRGLALDWIDEEQLRRVREVCIVPAAGMPDLKDYSLITDDSTVYKIVWGQAFRPGPTRIFYVFGLVE
jgi:hypothetical protein